MNESRHGKHKHQVRTVSGITDEEYKEQRAIAREDRKTWSAWMRELAAREVARVRDL